MKKQRFTGRLKRNGNRIGIQLPFDPNIVWGAKRQHHITGSINGLKIRGALQQDGPNYELSVGAAWLRDHDVVDGTAVDVILEPEGPQFDDLEPDFAAALNAEPEARAFFEALATFYRTTYLKWLAGAKQGEKRQARVREIVSLLKEGKKQR